MDALEIPMVQSPLQILQTCLWVWLSSELTPFTVTHLHTVTWLTNPQSSTNSDYLGRAELFSVPEILFPPGVITRAIKTSQLSPSIISWENRSQNRLYIYSAISTVAQDGLKALLYSLLVFLSLSQQTLAPPFLCVITGYYFRVILWSFHFQAYQFSGLGQDLQ